MDLKVDARTQGEVGVLVASGEIDVFTAPALDAALDAELTAGRASIVVDLSGVTFLDSTGLGVLVKGLKGSREAGGQLSLVVTSERIRKIFDITGLDASIPLFDSLDDALRG